MINARSIVSFFSSRTGLVILFVVGVGVLLAFTYHGTRKAEDERAERDRLEQAARESPLPVTATTQRDIAPAPVDIPSPTPAPLPVILPPPPNPTERAAVERKRAPLNIYTAQPTPTPDLAANALPVPGAGEHPYAPYGRLLECRLVNTVESINTRTPIIAVTTRSLWWDGKVVLPAGTELHGFGAPDALRDRIAAEGQWRAIIANTPDYPDGAELPLAAIALDMQVTQVEGEDGQPRLEWGQLDGSAGLKGEVIKSDEWAEIKLFAAQMISGAAAGFQETQPTLLGPVAVGGPTNAGLGAVTTPLNTYAERILESIERDGFFVRVPGGKTFYLYVTQPIDMRLARVATAPSGGAEGGAASTAGMLPLTPMQLQELILARAGMSNTNAVDPRRQQARQAAADRETQNAEANALNQQRTLQLLQALQQQQGGTGPGPAGPLP